jgi:hypothetical protein
MSDIAFRDELRELLRGLWPQERALRLPFGTVKSAASRALARLRVEVAQ